MTKREINKTNTPIELRNLWSTPQYVYEWANDNIFHAGFDIDLAASAENTKCSHFLTESDDSLNTSWSGYFDKSTECSRDHTDTAWLNPPYDNIEPWLKKAHEESLLGFSTCLLINSPNGEAHYGKWVYDKASEIIMIDGRLSFQAAGDFTIPPKFKNVMIKGSLQQSMVTPEQHIKKGDYKNGSTRGSCFVIYRPKKREYTETKLSWVSRDEMKKEYE